MWSSHCQFAFETDFTPLLFSIPYTLLWLANLWSSNIIIVKRWWKGKEGIFGDPLFSERKMGEVRIGKQIMFTSEWFQANTILYSGNFRPPISLGNVFVVNKEHYKPAFMINRLKFGIGKENKCTFDCFKTKEKHWLLRYGFVCKMVKFLKFNNE